MWVHVTLPKRISALNATTWTRATLGVHYNGSLGDENARKGDSMKQQIVGYQRSPLWRL